MSSILKALKKLEQEKSLHEESAAINVSSEILKQSSGNRNIIKWLWLLGTVATLVIIILTVALLKKSAPIDAVKSGEQPIASQLAVPPWPQNLPVSPDTAGNVRKTSPAPPGSADELPLKPSPLPPVEAGENSLKNERTAPPTATIPAGEPQITAPETKAAPARQASSDGPTLTLSGIAWNKDSADRLAIINGQPTATGANINGVIVEEILQDRVKLSQNGRIFELLIGRDAKTD